MSVSVESRREASILPKQALDVYTPKALLTFTSRLGEQGGRNEGGGVDHVGPPTPFPFWGTPKLNKEGVQIPSESVYVINIRPVCR